MYGKAIIGTNNIQQGIYPIQLNIDLPNNYRLNQNLIDLSIENNSLIILINTNLRYEASLLNTLIRREQKNSDIICLYLGIFVSLGYSLKHQGNNLLTLIHLLLNKNSEFKSLSLMINTPIIFLGLESRRFCYNHFLEICIKKRGKVLYINTKQKNRLGYIHNSIGTVAYSHLGLFIKSINFDINNTKSIITASNTFLIQLENKQIKCNAGLANNIYNFDTHLIEEENISIANQLPLTALYERDGHLLNREGRIRRHIKAINPIKQYVDLEIMLIIIASRFSMNYENVITILDKGYLYFEELYNLNRKDNLSNTFYIISYRQLMCITIN